MAKKRKGDTVLIIEDDADTRNFACRVLDLEGYDCLQAETGAEGLRLLKGNKVDLVLLDLRLPDDSGLVILERLQHDPETSAIPVIVFTAAFGEFPKEQALTLGAADYLLKPLSATGLKRAVALALQRKR